MRLHYLWPWKSQNRTIPVKLEAIQTTMIATKLFWPLYLGYNHILQYNYCGHFICNCPHVAHDIATGKCKRNQDGITKWCICSKRYNWQILMQLCQWMAQNNPNQLGAATLIHTINKHILEEQKSPNSSVYQLTATNCIVVLETIFEPGDKTFLLIPIAFVPRKLGTPM